VKKKNPRPPSENAKRKDLKGGWGRAATVPTQREREGTTLTAKQIENEESGGRRQKTAETKTPYQVFNAGACTKKDETEIERGEVMQITIWEMTGLKLPFKRGEGANLTDRKSHPENNEKSVKNT